MNDHTTIAAMALQGLLASPEVDGTKEQLAKAACEAADALLAELAKPHAPGVEPPREVLLAVRTSRTRPEPPPRRLRRQPARDRRGDRKETAC